jgi:pyridoxal phosphate enzyme (YggS family)
MPFPSRTPGIIFLRCRHSIIAAPATLFVAFQAGSCYFYTFMVKERLHLVEERIKQACSRAGRSPQDVHIVAVTKTLPPRIINPAIEAGLTNIGENRVQEYLGKREALRPHYFHMIGALQRNKVRQIIDVVSLIHSLDSVSLAEEIGRRAGALHKTVDVLIEINTSGEATKHGLQPREAETLMKSFLAIPRIRVCGLMTVAEYVENPEDVRASFVLLRTLRDELRRRYPEAPLAELSMGMTNDYEVAVEEGATIVRLGTALFGSRNYQ